MADSNHVAEETLSTIRTVRSFANEDGEIKRYNDTLHLFYKLKFKQAIVYSTYDWAVQVSFERNFIGKERETISEFDFKSKLATLFMTSSMLAYGAHLVSTKQITSADFMSFVIYQLTLGACLQVQFYFE